MNRRYLSLILLIPFMMVVFWFRNGNILGGGEGGIPFYNLEISAELTSKSWADLALGNVIGISTAAAPTYWVLSLLHKLGLPEFFIQALLYLVIFIISGYSVFRLSLILFPKISPRVALLATFFYWFNPATMINSWGRNLPNYMVFSALLPLGWYLYLQAIFNKKLRFGVLTALISAIFSYALTATPFNIILILLLFLTTVFFFLTEGQVKYKRYYLQLFAITFGCYLAFNFWWIGQLFIFIFSPAFSKATVDFFTPIGNLYTLNTLSTLLGNIKDVIRLTHGTFYHTAPVWARIYLSPFLVLISFYIPLMIFWTIYKFKNVKHVIFLGSLFILSLFLAKGSSLPFGELYQSAFVGSSIFQVFRNPFEKFSFLLAVVAAPLFAYGVGQIFINNKKLNNIFYVISVLVLFIYYGYPLWSGLIYTRINPNDTSKFVSYEVKVPNYYQEANEWLKQQAGSARGIVLPIGGESMTYTWDKPYAGVELSSALLKIPNLAFDTTIPFLHDVSSELFKYQLRDRILNFLPFLNARYIIWRSGIDFRDRQLPSPEVVKKILDDYVTKGLLTIGFQSNELVIYQAKQDQYWPKVFVTPRTLVSNGAELSRVYQLNPEPSLPLAILDSTNDSTPFVTDSKIILRPRTVFKTELNQVAGSYNDEDLLARLFHSKHLPDTNIYPLIRLKEYIETPRSSYYDNILYQVGILGKRAVEIYQVKKVAKPVTVIDQAEASYVDNLQTLAPILKHEVQTNGPARGWLVETLIHQFLLLNSAQSKVRDDIGNFLIEIQVIPRYNLPDLYKKEYQVYLFEIEKAGFYQIDSDEKLDNVTIFLDGQEQAVETGKAITLDLKEGTHEVALYSDSNFYSPLLEVEYTRIDDKSEFIRRVDLTNHYDRLLADYDYRFKQGGLFSTVLRQDIDKIGGGANLTTFKDKVQHDWIRAQQFFPINPAASYADFGITASFADCSLKLITVADCNRAIYLFAMEIRNLKLKAFKRPDLILVSDGELARASSTKVRWTKVNSTLYKLNVEKVDDQPEVLVFSELFNSNWQLYLDKQKPDWSNSSLLENWRDNSFEYRIAQGDWSMLLNSSQTLGKHLLVNSYANGWLIDKAGEYDLVITFAPQRFFLIGKAVSFIAVLTALVVLVYLKWKKS